MNNKIIDIEKVATYIKSGMSIMIGGFLGNGNPIKVIDFLLNLPINNLTIISNDTAMPDVGIGKLIVNKQVKKVITSHIGTNPITGEMMTNGELEVEFVPQGTLAERIRCAGAGLGGCLTKTGLGTVIAENKRIINIEGTDYLLELPLRADVALLCASVADEQGNLFYKGTSQNFNPIMATAADIVFAEVEQLVKIGDILPETVHTPAIFVDYLVIA